MPSHYTIRHAEFAPPLDGSWDSTAWVRAETLNVVHFRPESSDHRPITQARLLYDAEAIHGIFRVKDRYVRCVHAGFNDPVSRDSCVEFFVRPTPAGYFNFEFNCGGALLAYYITDHRRIGDGFAAYTRLTPEDGAQVGIYHSLPNVVEPEIADPVTWTLQFRIPFALIARYAGPLAMSGWRANFYKCGDETSHPHWAAWSPVDALNFHLPACFGDISFEGVKL